MFLFVCRGGVKGRFHTGFKAVSRAIWFCGFRGGFMGWFHRVLWRDRFQGWFQMWFQCCGETCFKSGFRCGFRNGLCIALGNSTSVLEYQFLHWRISFCTGESISVLGNPFLHWRINNQSPYKRTKVPQQICVFWFQTGFKAVA